MPIAPLAAVALLAAATASAGDGEVSYRLALHGRFTDRENTPDPSILFDRATRAFDVASYLKPQGSDAYGSAFVSAGLEGHHGWFRWALAADTGELREQRFHQQSEVCPASRAPPGGVLTGLDVVGSGRCALLLGTFRTVLLDDTRLQPAQVTSNGRPIAEEARQTLLLREAWVGAAMGRNDFALVKVGRKRFTVADGFVYDDYGTGVDASFDLGALGPSFEVGAAAFYPTREFPSDGGARSPMLALRADWLPSLFEHAGLFFAVFRDRSDGVAELFRGSFAEPSVVRLQGIAPGTLQDVREERTLAAILGSASHSEGTLAWLGTSGSLGLGHRVKLDWTGALERGRVTLTTGPLQSQGDVSGELAWLRLRHEATRALELSGFFLYESGDLPPAEKKRLGLPPHYGGFLGLSPYVTTTNIFFQGGVAETFASRQATAPGVNARGVVAPGIAATVDATATLSFDARAAYLVAPERGPFGGSNYGPEVDLSAAWSPVPWLTFVAEGDVLFPGDFFPARTTVTKVVIGVDVVAP